MQLRSASGKTYFLDSMTIGSGGEGDIYPIRGESGKVAKIYKPSAMTLELEEKLKVMVANPPNKAVFTQVAWPLDVLYDDGGQCRGFVMPRLNITHELGEIYKYPIMLPLSAHQKVNIAQNICVVISEVHKAGYVFGDFNPRNIGLDINTGLVSFLDTDTYHVYDKNKSVTHRCNVCAPGYAAPELLARCSEYVAKNPEISKHAYARTPLPTFTKETDNFALAIHIFKLLMNGYTPFGGIIETASVSQSSPGVGDAAVKRDNYCFKPGFKHQSAAILPLEAFPQEIADLFTRAFILGKIDPRQRPKAEDWHSALVKLGQSMTVCHAEPLHYYYKENSSCPLCEADARFAEAIGQGSRKNSTAPGLSQTVYVNPMQAKNIPRGAAHGQTSISQAMNQSIVQPPKRSRTPVLLAGIVGGMVLLVMILAVAHPGGIIGLIDNMGFAPAPAPAPAPGPTPALALPPAHEATPTPAPVRYSVGDIIQFGPYDWRVLDVQGNQALIITDRVIDQRMYHHTIEAVTWETSEIRQWLNNDFFSSFSPEDRARIAETHVINNDNPWDFSEFHGWVNTPGGNNTVDRIFLLSIDEVLRYFGDSGLVALVATMGFERAWDYAPEGWSWEGVFDQYSEARITWDIGGSNSLWLLRSPGSRPSFVAFVDIRGYLGLSGTYAANWRGDGIRPALWLYLEY